MKKVCLVISVLAIILTFTNGLFSQTSLTKATTSSNWDVGITAGPQFTNITSSGLFAPPENGVGFLAGIFTEYKVHEKFKIRLGIDFDRRSFSTAYKTRFLVFQDSIITEKSYSAYDVKFNLDYLTLPLSLIYVTGGDRFKMFVRGTFYYSVLLTAHRKGYSDIYIDDADYEYAHQDFPFLEKGHNRKEYDETTDTFLGNEKFNTNDIGLSFFIGAIYKLSEKVDLYLSPGFTSSFGHVLENPVYDSKWIQVFKIETGVVINLN